MNAPSYVDILFRIPTDASAADGAENANLVHVGTFPALGDMRELNLAKLIDVGNQMISAIKPAVVRAT